MNACAGFLEKLPVKRFTCIILLEHVCYDGSVAAVLELQDPDVLMAI